MASNLIGISQRETRAAMTSDTTDLRHRFRDVVTSEEELWAIAGPPHQRAIDKVVRVIDDHSRRFIAHASVAPRLSTPRDGRV